MRKSRNAIIVHGSGGYPERNWFPWLKQELELRDISTIVPQFPTPDGQSLESWIKVFDKYIKSINSNLLLFGHSTGVALLLNVLAQSNQAALATFLVAGFVGEIGNSTYDPLNRTFFEKPINFDLVRKNSGHLFLYCGDNDPYVPLDKSKELAQLLNSKLTIIPCGGHLNQDSGFTKFERLLDDLENVIKK